MKNELTESQKAACRAQFELQVKVCKRVEGELPGIAEAGGSRARLLMDLDSVPDLDLQKLLDAPKIDFAHDIYGITRHMDRSTYPGKLTDCFSPRCCRPQLATATHE